MEDLNVIEYLLTVIGVLITAIGTLLIVIFKYAGAQFQALRNSVSNIEKNFPAYTHQTESNTKKIHEFEKRLRVVEQK